MTATEQIVSFKEQEWVWERSGGYAGYRNTSTGQWIYEREFWQRRDLFKRYSDQYQFLRDFRGECLPYGLYPEYVLMEFLEKRFQKEADQVYSSLNNHK